MSLLYLASSVAIISVRLPEGPAFSLSKSPTPCTNGELSKIIKL